MQLPVGLPERRLLQQRRLRAVLECHSRVRAVHRRRRNQARPVRPVRCQLPAGSRSRIMRTDHIAQRVVVRGDNCGEGQVQLQHLPVRLLRGQK
jgi:hypothetical protein